MRFKAGYINAQVHKADEQDFEILETQLLSLSFRDEHSCLEEEVGTLGLEYILGDLNLVFPELKVGQEGEIIAAVYINYTRSWTDCGEEWDVDFDLEEVKTKVYPQEEQVA